VRLRTLIVAGLTAAALGALAATASAQATDAPNAEPNTKVYLKYAAIRQQLLSCFSGRAYKVLSRQEVKDCGALAKRYTLFQLVGEYYIHCNTSKCVAAPVTDPSPRGAYPDGAKLLRWRTPKPAT